LEQRGLIEDTHPLYCGRGGHMGDRPGIFAVQNADLLLAIGIRISIRQIGYNWKTWAREAEVIMVDIDRAELKKPTLHVDMSVWADARDFLEALERRLENRSIPVSGRIGGGSSASIGRENIRLRWNATGRRTDRLRMYLPLSGT